MTQQGTRSCAAQALPARAPRPQVPDATVGRLPVYLRALRVLADDGRTTVSSAALATAAGVASAQLRRDLSHLGSYGTRGVGYEVQELVFHISRELGLGRRWPVVLVGVGNLGLALAGYAGFDERGFTIDALLDVDETRVGQHVGDHVVRHVDELEDVVRSFGVCIGVIATPAAAAQDVCDRMVGAGVRSILNFAPVVLRVPPQVDVRKVDLSNELQILSFREHRKTGLHLVDGSGVDGSGVDGSGVDGSGVDGSGADGAPAGTVPA